MPLRVIRSASAISLWRAFSDGFLADLGSCTGPSGYRGFAWLTHRLQRDRLWADAATRCKGWLRPPHAFFSELPRLFGFVERPVSVFERSLLIGRLSEEAAVRSGFAAPGTTGRPGLGRAIDQVLGDLLPEGIGPDRLAAALAAASPDEFARRRNECLVEVARRYREELSARRSYDPRAVHSLVADRIDAGELRRAIGGAARLHLYGLATARTRLRLLGSLRDQTDVEVLLYQVGDSAPAANELGELLDLVTDLPGGPPEAVVQPAPDEQREMELVALEIKKAVSEDRVPLDDIAVVARTGRADARFAHETLERSGVPTTARIRTPLNQIPALAAVLELIRASARGWAYRPLRQVFESSYFSTKVDLRTIDRLAAERRYAGLAAWEQGLRRLAAQAEKEAADADPERAKARLAGLGRTIEAFAAFAGRAAGLEQPRPIVDWVRVTRDLLDPGWFDYRANVCAVIGGRHDIVRLDQQGIEATVRLLLRWQEAEPDGDPIEVAEWYDRLERFLRANELSLATPRRTGVQVIEAHEAALLPFRRTFLIHANDGEFPKRPPAGGLFTDRERRQLRAAGLPLADRELALERERALWRAVTAGPATTITYRTADPSGVPLLPSLVVPDHDPAAEIPRTRFVWPTPFTPDLARRADVDRLAEAARGNDPRVTTTCALPLRLAVLRAYGESRRLGRPDGSRPAGLLDPWNGQLRDPLVLDQLRLRFGADRIWSASQLETWTQNPFVFLIGRVLNLESQDEAEEDPGALIVGNVTHRILEEVFRDGGGPAAVQRLDSVADRVFAELEAEGEQWLGLPGLWAVRRKAVREMVRLVVKYEVEKAKDWIPEEVEFEFGEPDGPGVDIRGRDLNGQDTSMGLRGRIDRIDRRGAGSSLERRIVDYKSGAVPLLAGYEDGTALQAPLYLAALAAIGRPAISAEYRPLKKPGCHSRLEFGSDQAAHAVRIALTVPSLIRQGRFESRACGSWKWYWPGGLALYRCQAMLDGSRFDE